MKQGNMKDGDMNDRARPARGGRRRGGDLPPPRELHRELWLLTVGPLIWALHFLLSYGTAAVWCAKLAGPAGSLDGARLAIGVYTLLAVTGIGLTAWLGFRRAALGRAEVPRDDDSAHARRQFLGFATLLLCLLSLVATAYVALGAVFIGSCR